MEGETDDPEILALRARQKRNFMATLLFSQGVPMLRHGDELSHSQCGDNNAYCQDNELPWLNWELGEEETAFLEFVQRTVSLRREHPFFRRRKFFQGHPIHGKDGKDIVWLNPDRREMSDEEWSQHAARCLGIYLSGTELNEADERGNPLIDDDFVPLISAHEEPIPFLLPAYGRSDSWICLMDTSFENGVNPDDRYGAGDEYPLQGRSLVLLMRPRS